MNRHRWVVLFSSWIGLAAAKSSGIRSGRLDSTIISSRSIGEGRSPSQPADVDVDTDRVYDGLCDHFIGYNDYNNIRCANRCRAIFARKNGMKTAGQRARERLGVSAVEYAKIVEQDQRIALDIYDEILSIPQRAFDQLIYDLAPTCVFQSYKLAGNHDDEGSVTVVDGCFSNLVLTDPQLLESSAVKTQGMKVKVARSPAHCQYLCQQEQSDEEGIEDCYAFSFDTRDESTCLLYSRKQAAKFGMYARSQLSTAHPCSLEANSDPTVANGCQLCDNKRTVAYENKIWISGTKHCLKQVQTMCELTPTAPEHSPFGGDWKDRFTDNLNAIKKAHSRRFRWRYKGEDEWHTGLKYIEEN